MTLEVEPTLGAQLFSAEAAKQGDFGNPFPTITLDNGQNERIASVSQEQGEQPEIVYGAFQGFARGEGGSMDRQAIVPGEKITSETRPGFIVKAD